MHTQGWCLSVARVCNSYDGAEPTASSVAAGNLLRLAALIPQRAEGAGSGSSSKEGAATRVLSYHQRAVSTFAAFRVSCLHGQVAFLVTFAVHLIPYTT
jgi:hypothetical protein